MNVSSHVIYISNSWLYGSQWESLAAAWGLYKVMQESVSGTTNHMFWV